LILSLFTILIFIALLIAINTDGKQCKSTVDIVNQALQRWKEFAINKPIGASPGRDYVLTGMVLQII
jgi:hypothetical protein